MVGNTVFLFELAVGDHVQIAVDTLLLQTVDQIVQMIHGFGIQRTGGLKPATLGVGKNIGRVPLGIQLVEAHQITAGLCQTGSYLGCVILVGEAGAAVEVDAPKLCEGTVGKAQHLAVGTDKAMLAGRLLVLENEGDINGHSVGIGGHRNISGHRVFLSCTQGCANAIIFCEKEMNINHLYQNAYG